MMKLSTVSLLATTSAANASLRGGTVVMSLNAALSAIPAIPDPAVFMAGSIGEGGGTCETEYEQVWENADLNTANEGLESCYATNATVDGKTISVDFTSCDATATFNTACSSAGGMSYTIDVACSKTSGSGGIYESIDYSGMPSYESFDISGMPSCAGTSCTINDFNTMAKQQMESEMKAGIEEELPGTWSCTATASLSNPSSEEALLSVE